MIIECGYCGAPLDVEAGARTTRCEYCGTTSPLHSARTVHSETPLGWQPPTQWRPPEHATADSTQVFEYRARRAVTGLVVVAASLVLALGVVVFVILTLVQKTDSVSDTTTSSSPHTLDLDEGSLPPETLEALQNASREFEKARQRIEEARRSSGAAAEPVEAEPEEENLLRSAVIDELLAAYEEAVGGGALSLVELTLHEEHSSIEARSPHDPRHVDRYRYRRGVVGGSEAVRLAGLRKRNLAAHLFDPRKTALPELDRLKVEALERLGYEEAEVSHVIVSRDRGRGAEIRIYASTERESGYVRFSAAGQVVRVHR